MLYFIVIRKNKNCGDFLPFIIIKNKVTSQSSLHKINKYKKSHPEKNKKLQPSPGFLLLHLNPLKQVSRKLPTSEQINCCVES